MAKREHDTGEQAGVNCRGRIKRKDGGSTRCGQRMYWESRTGDTAVCRNCGRVEMLFRPTGQVSNRPPTPPGKQRPLADPVAEVEQLKSEMSSNCYDRFIDEVIDELKTRPGNDQLD